MKVKAIVKVKGIIRIKFENKETVDFYHFGKTIYTIVSKNLSQNDVIGHKNNVVVHNWNVEKLKEIYYKKRSV